MLILNSREPTFMEWELPYSLHCREERERREPTFMEWERAPFLKEWSKEKPRTYLYGMGTSPSSFKRLFSKPRTYLYGMGTGSH